MGYSWSNEEIPIEEVYACIRKGFGEVFKLQETLDLDSGTSEIAIVCRYCGRKDASGADISVSDMVQISRQHSRCKMPTTFQVLYNDSSFLLIRTPNYNKALLYCDLCKNATGYFELAGIPRIHHKCVPLTFWFDGPREAKFLPTGFWELKFPFHNIVWKILQNDATWNIQREAWILREANFARVEQILKNNGVKIFPRPKARPQGAGMLVNSARAKAAIDIFSLMTPEIEKGIVRLFAKQYHSDTGHGDEEKMKQFNAAWSVITSKKG